MMKAFSSLGYLKWAIVIIMLLSFTMIVPDITAAQADRILLNGRVKSIDLTTNTVIVTDYEGKDFKLTIEDHETISKFKDGRIKAGDDVNVKYRIKDGKNIPFSFRKLAGC